MKQAQIIIISLSAILCSTLVFADEKTPHKQSDSDFKRNLIGVYGAVGIAHTVGDVEFADRSGDSSPRVAGGFGVTYDRLLTMHVAFSVGLGITGKGYKGATIENEEFRNKATVLELPIGTRLSIKNFRIGLAMFVSLCLREKNVYDDDDKRIQHSMFNLGPMVGFEYVIPVGRFFITPGVNWSIHILDDYQTTTAPLTPPPNPEPEPNYRRMNAMFYLKLQLGI